MNRAARKDQFGQAIISVFKGGFTYGSRCSKKSIWTRYYKRILNMFLHMNRAARKGKFGQTIICVFGRCFSHESRCSGKSIWTSYYKRILKVVFT